jgi:hypothetical protein
MNNTNYKRDMLLYFLDNYLSKKNLIMKDLMINVRYILQRKKQISLKQFMALIKFIERERQFRNVDRSKILNYFSPLIKGYHKNDDGNSNTIELQ